MRASPALSNRPIFALLILAVWIAITFFGEYWQAGRQQDLDRLISHEILLAFVAANLFLLAALAALKWRDVGFARPDPPRSIVLLWLPAIYVCALLAAAVIGGLPAPAMMAVILVNTLLVGLSEETMFRGILFKAFLSRFSIWPAVWGTSILFGSVHALNGFLTGDPEAALVQAGAATTSGVYFAALRVRTASLYPGIAIHALWDFSILLMASSLTASSGSSSPQAWLGPLALVLPLFLYGLFLLRGLG